MNRLILRCKTYSKHKKLRLNFVRWSFFVTFAAMIQELPRYENVEDYYKEPLLEYVVKVANHFWKCYDSKKRMMINSVVPEDFCKRYHEGKINTVSRQNFLYAVEINDTLKAYKIDVDKFWYLCLLVKDYSEGQTLKASLSNPTHKEEINLLIAELGKLTHDQKGLQDKMMKVEPAIPANRPKAQENIIKTDLNGKLTLRIEKNKAITITDGQTLVILREALARGLRFFRNDSILNTAPTAPHDASILGIQYRVVLFYNYMKWFLEQFTPQKKGTVSIDKTLLISRLIYVLDIDADPQYYDTRDNIDNRGKKEYLLNKIKRYKDISVPVRNLYYRDRI